MTEGTVENVHRQQPIKASENGIQKTPSAESKHPGPKVTCDPSLFQAQPAVSAKKQSSDLENIKSSEAKVVYDSSMFMARPAESISTSKSEKDTMPGQSSSHLTPRQQLSGSFSSLSSTSDEDRKQLVMNGSLDFPSEDRIPAGSGNHTKDAIQPSNRSVEHITTSGCSAKATCEAPNIPSSSVADAYEVNTNNKHDSRDQLESHTAQHSKNDEPSISKEGASLHSSKTGNAKTDKRKMSKLKKLVNGRRKGKQEGKDKGKKGKDKQETANSVEAARQQQREDDLKALNEYLSSLSRAAPDGCSNNMPHCGNTDNVKADIESEDEYENAPTRTISTVTLGKKRMHQRCKHRSAVPVQLYSIGRGALRPAIIEDDLVIIDLLPNYAKNERVLLPKDSAPPNKHNDHDKYGYLNTSLKEIKIVPKPIFTVGRDSEASEFIDFDELPSQRGIWTPISCCDVDCFAITDDIGDEPPPIYYGFGHPNAATHANEQLSLYTFNKLHRQNLKAPVNPHDKARVDRETVADYIQTVDPDRPNVDMEKKIDKMKKKGIEHRIRRKIEEGSYSNFSVDEKKLFTKKDTILRYTWKGKLIKLRKLLKNTKTHKYINRQDYCGRTALHYAASWDCPQIMKLLLSVPGINVNLQDGDRKTPLRKACEIKSFDCVKLLAEFGANMRIVGVDRRNPFEYLLQEQGDDAIEIAKFLYNDPQIYNERTEVGVVSHLHQLCLSKVKVVKLAEELIKSGASINATEGNGRTPLILATQNDRPELIELFLKYKADVMHIDLDYCNALQYAIPGETCHTIIKKAMALQPKCKDGVGMINGRLRNSERLRRGTNINILGFDKSLNKFQKNSKKL